MVDSQGLRCDWFDQGFSFPIVSSATLNAIAGKQNKRQLYHRSRLAND